MYIPSLKKKLELGCINDLAQHGKCPIFFFKNHSTLLYCTGIQYATSELCKSALIFYRRCLAKHPLNPPPPSPPQPLPPPPPPPLLLLLCKDHHAVQAHATAVFDIPSGLTRNILAYIRRVGFSYEKWHCKGNT